ncbi:MAG: 3-hydroxy-3-methylglutaryl-CoA reductase, partial [Methanospirillum sp.]|nr:3-hydroxy-3-methylglutaryl-CoA reductase [Methanospirillum sp.]
MDDYLRRIRDGSLKLYVLEKELTPGEAVLLRRRYIEEETGISLPRIGECSIDLDTVVKRNCENMIG